MRDNLVSNLADCTEYRQALQARPPRVVHGTAMLLMVLLGAALAWAALTEADLVVRASGLVRPATPTQAAKTRFGGRVVKVYFRAGQEVRKDDRLVQLDTEKLDNDIQKRELTIRAAEKELAKLYQEQESLAKKLEADTAVVEAKLAYEEEEFRQGEAQRASDLRVFQRQFQLAEDKAAMTRRLTANGAASREQFGDDNARALEALEKWKKAQLRLNDNKVKMAHSELEALKKTYEKERTDLERRQVAKQGEIQAAQKDLDNLMWERDQASVRAPIQGVVTSRDLREGAILEAGAVVAELAERPALLFEAQVPNEEIGHLREGMPARIKLGPFHYQEYGTLKGRVSFLSPDSEVGEQRGACYTAKIELEETELGRGDLRGQVKLGMAGQAEIVTRRESLLSLLMRRLRQTMSLG